MNTGRMVTGSRCIEFFIYFFFFFFLFFLAEEVSELQIFFLVDECHFHRTGLSNATLFCCVC